MVEATTRKTSWIRRSVWFLAIFAVIAVVILGDFQAISAASSTIELPWRSVRRTEDVVIRVDMSKPGDPDEFRKMRDQYKAKKASQGASRGGDAARGDPGQKREDAGPLNVTGAPDLATTGWVAWPPPNPPPSMHGAGGGGEPKDGGEPSNLGDELGEIPDEFLDPITMELMEVSRQCSRATWAWGE